MHEIMCWRRTCGSASNILYSMERFAPSPGTECVVVNQWPIVLAWKTLYPHNRSQMTVCNVKIRDKNIKRDEMRSLKILGKHLQRNLQTRRLGCLSGKISHQSISKWKDIYGSYSTTWSFSTHSSIICIARNIRVAGGTEPIPAVIGCQVGCTLNRLDVVWNIKQNKKHYDILENCKMHFSIIC